MITLIDVAMKSKLESLMPLEDSSIVPSIYSDVDNSFKEYVNSTRSPINIPFTSFISTNTELDLIRYNHHAATRGIRTRDYADSTQEVQTFTATKLVPININYRVALFAKTRQQLYAYEKQIVFWLGAIPTTTSGHGTLQISYPDVNGDDLKLHSEFNLAQDETISPGLTLEKYEKGKYYVSTTDIIVKGFLAEDTTIKTILKANIRFFDGFYQGQYVSMENFEYPKGSVIGP